MSDMSPRITFGEGGEFTVPRELVEGEPVEEGTIMRAHLDEEGNVILRPLAPTAPRRYSIVDREAFAAEDEMTPELEERLERVLAREPRFFRR